MNRFCIVAVALIGTLAIPTDSQAQIRVGPFGGVNIRVPFVGVDVLPFGGGTRVRAPFTSVRTGLYGYGPVYGPGYGSGYGSVYAVPRPYDDGYYGRGYARPYFYDPGPVLAVPVLPPVYDAYADPNFDPGYVYPDPYLESVPSIDQPGYQSAHPVMPSPNPDSTGSIEEDLRTAAERLARGLSSRRDDADVWMSYLQPDLIIQTIDQGGSPSQLKSLLLNYEGLSGNSQLSGLWLTDGFRETHQLLRQWVETSAPTQSQSSVSTSDGKPTSSAPVKAATNNDTAKRDAEELPVPRPTTDL